VSQSGTQNGVFWRQLFVCVSVRVLQCVVGCCSVLQSVAVCCSVLQCDWHILWFRPFCYMYDMTHSHVRQNLMCVAACCSVLQCVAVCCSLVDIFCFSVPSTFLSHMWHDSFTICDMIQSSGRQGLRCVAVCCSVLQCSWHFVLSLRQTLKCVALHCGVLQWVAVCCSVLQIVAVCCSVVQCG